LNKIKFHLIIIYLSFCQDSNPQRFSQPYP